MNLFEEKDIMNMREYNKVKGYTYLEYCNYLQKKYGIGRSAYMFKNGNRNPKCSRTSDGLLAHHKYEDHAIMLGSKTHALTNPYEWQLPENIVYCDYLEHLLLHILICEFPAKNKNKYDIVGIGGIINFIVPELNDVYSGWKSNQKWRLKCHSLIINDKDVYLKLIKRFVTKCSNHPLFNKKCLLTSFNSMFGLWDKNNNKDIYKKIKSIVFWNA